MTGCSADGGRLAREFGSLSTVDSDGVEVGNGVTEAVKSEAMTFWLPFVFKEEVLGVLAPCAELSTGKAKYARSSTIRNRPMDKKASI